MDMMTGELQIRAGSRINGCNGCEKAFEQVTRNENRADDRGAGWVSMRYDVAFYVAQCSAK